MQQSQWDTLNRNGYLIIDSFFSEDKTNQFRKEIKLLKDKEHLFTNKTHFIQQNTLKYLEKKNIYETELAHEVKSYSDHIPVLIDLFQDPKFIQNCYEFRPDLEICKQMIKVQYNQGNGGCFPLHFDTNGKDGRKLTAIFYLNENWQSSDGGELVVFPFPFEPITIPPLDNRLVVFSSEEMLHSVLPSNKERYCLTIWLYANADRVQSQKNKYSIPEIKSKFASEYDRGLAILLQNPIRKHFAKLLYQHTWRQSLGDSHPSTEELNDFIKLHKDECLIIERTLNSILQKNQISSNVGKYLETLPLKSFNEDFNPLWLH